MVLFLLVIGDTVAALAYFKICCAAFGTPSSSVVITLLAAATACSILSLPITLFRQLVSDFAVKLPRFGP